MKRTLFRIDCWSFALFSITQALPVGLIADIGDKKLSKITTLDFNNVCVYNDVTYEAGANFTTDNPCQTCVCNPPGYKCTFRSCDLKPGCRAIHTADKCCPQYLCECERNGRMYGNGEKVEEPNPCKVCYCKGGEIKCALVTCYSREDCQPIHVPGKCCPKYDHCPPLEKMKNNSTSPKPSLVVISDLLSSESSSSMKPNDYGHLYNTYWVTDLFHSNNYSKGGHEGTESLKDLKPLSVATLEVIEIHPTAATYAKDFSFDGHRFTDVSWYRRSVGSTTQLFDTSLRGVTNEEEANFSYDDGFEEANTDSTTFMDLDIAGSHEHPVVTESTTDWDNITQSVFDKGNDTTETPQEPERLQEELKPNSKMNSTEDTIRELSIETESAIVHPSTEILLEHSTEFVLEQQENLENQTNHKSSDNLENISEEPEKQSEDESTELLQTQNLTERSLENSRKEDLTEDQNNQTDVPDTDEGVSNSDITLNSETSTILVDLESSKPNDIQELDCPDDQGNGKESTTTQSSFSTQMTNIDYAESEISAETMTEDKFAVNKSSLEEVTTQASIDTNEGSTEKNRIAANSTKTTPKAPSSRSLKLLVKKTVQTDVEETVRPKAPESPAPVVVMISAEQMQFLKVGEEPPVYVDTKGVSPEVSKAKIQQKDVLVVPRTTPMTVEMVKVINLQNGTVN